MQNAKPQDIDDLDELSTRRLEIAEAERPAKENSARTRLKIVDRNGSTIWEPVTPSPGSAPTTTQVLNAMRELPAALSADVEARLLHALTRPRAESEGHHLGAIRREQELAAVLMDLDATSAFQLNRRLDIDREDDPIVVAFRRLIPARRQRLRIVLDQRRRMLAACAGT